MKKIETGVVVLCDWGENVHLHHDPCNFPATIERVLPFTRAIGDPSDRTKELYNLCAGHAAQDAYELHINTDLTDRPING